MQFNKEENPPPPKTKHIARDYICALLSDSACLQKSAATRLANAVHIDRDCLEVLLSLVRGEPPQLMPSFAAAKGIFIENETWVKNVHLIEATDTAIGKNTLRACLKSEVAWERARILSLNAVVKMSSNAVGIVELLQHLLVGIKETHEKKLTENHSTNIELACMYIDAIPDGGNFEYLLLQIINANPKLTWHVLQRLVNRAARDIELLSKCKGVIHRTLYNEPDTPVFRVLAGFTKRKVLAEFGIVHFCLVNRTCLNKCADHAIQTVDKLIHNNSKLRMAFFLSIVCRFEEIEDYWMRQRYYTILKTKLNKDCENNCCTEIKHAVTLYPNVIRLVIDAIVVCAFKSCLSGHGTTEHLILIKHLLDIIILEVSRKGYEKLPQQCLDLASLLKIKTFVVYLEHAGEGSSDYDKATNFLTSITELLTDDFILAYIIKFNMNRDFRLDLNDIWDEIAQLIEAKEDTSLLYALKDTIIGASDVVWSINNAQYFYLENAIYSRMNGRIHVPIAAGNYFASAHNTIRDHIRICLGLLTLDSNLHAHSIRYILEVSMINNEEALFFVPMLIESTIEAVKKLLAKDRQAVIEMVKINVNTLVKLARHKLALPVCFSALQYIFKHATHMISKQADAEYKCLLLKSSELPASKMPLPSMKDVKMDFDDQLCIMTIYQCICECRPQEGMKRLSDIAPAFPTFPDLAISCITNLCKAHVLDFGIAYNMYVKDIFQNSVARAKVVAGSVARFFCEYTKTLINRLEANTHLDDDGDIVDLNIILPNVANLCNMEVDGAYACVGILFKSKVWQMIRQVQHWHNNKECDCFSLLEQIKRQELTCRYAQLSPKFFTLDFIKIVMSNINNNNNHKGGANSQDPIGNKNNNKNGICILIAGLLDASNTLHLGTSSADFLSNINRDFYHASRELTSTFVASAEKFSWLNKLHNSESTELENLIPSGLHMINYRIVLDLFRIKMACGGVALTEAQLEKLYTKVVSTELLSTPCSSPGSLIIPVAILCNSTFSKLEAFSDYMFNYIKSNGELLECIGGPLNVDVERLVCFSFGLAHLHGHRNLNRPVPLVLTSLIKAAMSHARECMSIVNSLFLALGSVYYRYSLPFHKESFSNVLSLYEEFLSLDPVDILGWAIGLVNLMNNCPSTEYATLKHLVLKLVSIANNGTFISMNRAILHIPAIYFCSIYPCPEVSSTLSAFLTHVDFHSCRDAHQLMLLAVCHHLGYNFTQFGFKRESFTNFILTSLAQSRGNATAKIIAICLAHNFNIFFCTTKLKSVASISESVKTLSRHLMAISTGEHVQGNWSDENAALVATLYLHGLRSAANMYGDPSAPPLDDTLGLVAQELKSNPHSSILLKALTLCRPLSHQQLALARLLEIEAVASEHELQLLMKVAAVHGQASPVLLQNLIAVAKMYPMFNEAVKRTFLQCLLLAIWNIDFGSLRAIFSYIADVNDVLFLETVAQVLEIVRYGTKPNGCDAGRINDNRAIQMDTRELYSLLLPIVCMTIKRSERYAHAIVIYNKATQVWDCSQQQHLATALEESSTAFKCLLNRIYGESMVSLNECFSLLIQSYATLPEIVLFAAINRHRHVDVILHCIHVLNVHMNPGGVVLVMLVVMTVVAYRNLQGHLFEFLYEMAPHHGIFGGILDFVNLSTRPNVLQLETLDPSMLSASANMTVEAPGMWEDCGLQSTWLGSLSPMHHDRRLVEWLRPRPGNVTKTVKTGNLELDATIKELQPMEIPRANLESSCLEPLVREMLVRNEQSILAAYRSLISSSEYSKEQTGKIINFLHSRGKI